MRAFSALLALMLAFGCWAQSGVRPGLASTGRLDFSISDIRTIVYDRGRRTATATVSGRTVRLRAERHPGALLVVIFGDGEIAVENWHRPTGHFSIWQTLTPRSAPLGDRAAELTLELPAGADTSSRFTVSLLSKADIDAAGSVGLVLLGR